MFGYLYWLITHPTLPQPKPRIFLKKRTKRMLRLLKALDAARTLQLARANAGIFTSA